MWKKISSNTFVKIYLIILIPIIILVFGGAFVINYYAWQYEKLLQNSYGDKFKVLFLKNENEIDSIIRYTHMLSNNPDFLDFASSVNKNFTENVVQTNKIIEILKEMKSEYDIIDSVGIVKRADGYIITDSGNHNFQSYFSDEYIYENYSYYDWLNYRAISDQQILAPTVVREYDIEKSILPVVFTSLNNNKIRNLILVNIDVDKIIEKANEEKLTANSTIFLINAVDKKWFYDKKKSQNIFLENDFYEQITKKKDVSFTYKSDDGSKYLVFSDASGISLQGYSYTVAIPYEDIHKRIAGVFWRIALLICFLFPVVLILVYISTKKVVKPLKSLAKLFGDGGECRGNNMVDYLQSSIFRVIGDNKKLVDQYSTAESIMKEKLLINLLNSGEGYLDQKSADKLSELILQFKKPYFMSVVIKLRNTDLFYETFSALEANLIQAGIYGIIQEILGKRFDVTVLVGEKDTLYMLFNLETDVVKQKVLDSVDEVKANFAYDFDYMHMSVGAGNIYAGVDGLKRSHMEAMESVSYIAENRNALVSEENEETSIIFTINDEQTLINYLMTGAVDRARQFIDEVLEKNRRESINKRSQTLLYSQFIHIIFKVIGEKGINIDDSKLDYMYILSSMSIYSEEEIYNTILVLLKRIEEDSAISENVLNINEVLEYINQHFCEDLYLEMLAERFNCSSKHLSRMIKNTLGIGFYVYLTGLRMNRAKLLLSKTNNSITDIYTELGYVSRSTFIRTFKKAVGITPTEYRAANKGE